MKQFFIKHDTKITHLLEFLESNFLLFLAGLFFIWGILILIVKMTYPVYCACPASSYNLGVYFLFLIEKFSPSVWKVIDCFGCKKGFFMIPVDVFLLAIVLGSAYLFKKKGAIFREFSELISKMKEKQI